MTPLAEQLSAIAKQLHAHFTFNGKPMKHEEVFDNKGLLPGMAKRADQLASLCLGYGIGVTFDQTENTPLGVEVKFDEFTPQALRLLCITDVICELMQSAPSKDVTPLDELMYD